MYLVMDSSNEIKTNFLFYFSDSECFIKKGMVHHKRMMGGADGKNSLDSYVTLSLVIAGMIEGNSEVRFFKD